MSEEHRLIYLDNNATTPLDSRVLLAMQNSLSLYGNPSSMHSAGRAASNVLEEARNQLLHLIGVEHSAVKNCEARREFIFCSGGSEANNQILDMMTGPLCEEGRCRLVTSVIEHPSVLEKAKHLESLGVPVTYVPVDKSGHIQIDAYKEALGDDVALVSIMYGNNEIGTIQDIKTLVKLAHEKGALFHTDAVQAVGKIPIDVKSLGVDYLTLSGHKLYGPKGVGGLYAKSGVPISGLLKGGHQEHGLRAGTYNTMGIIGLGVAAEIAEKEMGEDTSRIQALCKQLKEGILERVPKALVNGSEENSLPGTLNISFPGAEGESILLYLDFEGIAVSTGSACATGSLEPSYVITALGASEEIAHSSIRFSIGKHNTHEEIEYVLEKLPPIIEKIRDMSTVRS